MRSRLCIFLFFSELILFSPLRAEVEVVAGEPVTVAVSEPFGVAFDSRGILYGVEAATSSPTRRTIATGVTIRKRRRSS